MSIKLVSRYASLPQFASPSWQKILADPIQIALENHTMAWGDLDCPMDNDPSLKCWMTKPIVQTYEEPKSPRVRFADAPLIVPSAPLKAPRMEKIVYPNPLNICTVIIYNLPRTTTRDDLENNLSEYGVIEQITIPKNMDSTKGPVGSIKGFAMVRFSHPQESATAVAVEKSRRTQIEFAKSDRK